MKKFGIMAKIAFTLAIIGIFTAMMGVSFVLWVMFIKLCQKF